MQGALNVESWNTHTVNKTLLPLSAQTLNLATILFLKTQTQDQTPIANRSPYPRLRLRVHD